MDIAQQTTRFVWLFTATLYYTPEALVWYSWCSLNVGSSCCCYEGWSWSPGRNENLWRNPGTYYRPLSPDWGLCCWALTQIQLQRLAYYNIQNRVLELYLGSWPNQDIRFLQPNSSTFVPGWGSLPPRISWSPLRHGYSTITKEIHHTMTTLSFQVDVARQLTTPPNYTWTSAQGARVL